MRLVFLPVPSNTTKCSIFFSLLVTITVLIKTEWIRSWTINRKLCSNFMSMHKQLGKCILNIQPLARPHTSEATSNYEVRERAPDFLYVCDLYWKAQEIHQEGYLQNSECLVKSSLWIRIAFVPCLLWKWNLMAPDGWLNIIISHL